MKKNTSQDRKNNNLSEVIKEFSSNLTLGLKKKQCKSSGRTSCGSHTLPIKNGLSMEGASR